MVPTVASSERSPAAPRAFFALAPGREVDAFARALAGDGWAVAESAEDADSIVADAGPEGLAWLERAPSLPHRPDVVLVASFGTVQDAVEAMRRGAFDYLTRPTSPDHVVLALRRARERRALREENEGLRESLSERFSLGELPSKDARLRRVAEVVAAVADTRASVLITGESGTGKTLLARQIHSLSSRARKPFVVVDCGAVPANLLESSLFGHARGAFTGAVRDKPGVFELAHGGTVFLDEITNASLDVQAKLLRVVQERTFERVGETRTREADLRWIAASNRDLPREVREGRFREDLYWRLNVVALEVPPLRERPGDVPMLAEMFLRRFALEHGRKVQRIDPAVVSLLCAAPWPGNVRQLEHAVERAVLMARGDVLTLDDLSPELRSGDPASAALPPEGAGSLKRALEEPERELVRRALESCGGRRARAAALLGINRTTLFNKMRKLGLLDFPCGPRAALDSRAGPPHSAETPGRTA
jgi:DNA-binding NtrC family response regulator